jgi:hypothetical protein
VFLLHPHVAATRNNIAWTHTISQPFFLKNIPIL